MLVETASDRLHLVAQLAAGRVRRELFDAQTNVVELGTGLLQLVDARLQRSEALVDPTDVDDAGRLCVEPAGQGVDGAGVRLGCADPLGE